MSKILSYLFLAIIRVYQSSISPFIGAHCRYNPTCSAYGTEAIKKYGPFKGGWMALRRILSCHPWAKSGYDPVP